VSFAPDRDLFSEEEIAPKAGLDQPLEGWESHASVFHGLDALRGREISRSAALGRSDIDEIFVTNEDLQQLRRIAEHLTGLGSVGILSPASETERKVFSGATALSRRRWNLDQPGQRRFDLLIASNVFMYSPDPGRWFRHVLACTRYFLQLDPIRRRRSATGEFGADADRMRFRIGDARPRVERHFDLGDLGDRLLGFHTYFGGANTWDDDPLHVVALFRGDLADPILRIDDYPTGIRPIPDDLSPLHDLLHRVEARGLRYYLGIVPALVTDPMLRPLECLEHLVPAVHGYDHGHPKYAPLLRTKRDPFDERGVGAFNEFKGQSYDTILARLLEGQRVLEDRLGKTVEAYIPPCNVGDRRTARALVEAGYRIVLSEKRIPGCPLPWLQSDFSGRSNDYDYSRRPDVVTLNILREWDLVRRGETRAFDRLLDHLAERKELERARGSGLGAMIPESGLAHR
jgi:hypothetical protein